MELTLTPRILGQHSGPPLEFEVVRELRVEDLPLLSLPRPTGTNSPLKRLTDRHHAIARLIAGGHMNDGQIAALIGMSASTVARLKADPAFIELVGFYRTNEQQNLRTNFERLSGLAADAADVLQERLEEKPDDISVGQLIEIVKVGADRSGNGPQTSSVNVNIHADLADRLKRAREQARAAATITIEAAE